MTRVDPHRVRVERTRYEILHMLYESASRCAEIEVDISGFVRRIGVWSGELLRTLQYLHVLGYVRYSQTETGVSVCLTVQGVDYIERDARRRKTIRDQAGSVA